MNDTFAIPAASQIYLQQQEFLAVRAAETTSRNQLAGGNIGQSFPGFQQGFRVAAHPAMCHADRTARTVRD
jgi:hypothetical protein